MAPSGCEALEASRPESRAHVFHVPEASPEARVLPSGEKRMTVMGARWPAGLSSAAPVFGSSRTTVEGLASPGSPGLKATATASSP